MMQAVFGCYSAVALADVTALQLLPEKLMSLFKHRTWQTGAYQVLNATKCCMLRDWPNTHAQQQSMTNLGSILCNGCIAV